MKKYFVVFKKSVQSFNNGFMYIIYSFLFLLKFVFDVTLLFF